MISSFWKSVLGAVTGAFIIAVTAYAAEKAIDVVRLEVRVANIEMDVDEIKGDVKKLLSRD